MNDLIRHEFDTTDDRLLLLSPDLERGWKRHPRVTCFFEKLDIDSLADRRLKITIGVLPKNEHGYSQDWPDQPLLAERSSETHRRGAGRRSRNWVPVSWAVRDGSLTFRVPIIGKDRGFNPDLEWTQRRSEKLELRLVEYDLPAQGEPLQLDDGISVSLAPLVHFELQLQMLAEPRPLPKSVQRDWYKRFCPGGLPSLGKRA